MEIKNIEKQTVLSFETRTNYKNMLQFVGNTPAELMEYLAKQHISPVGNQIWAYEGCSDDPEKEFNLKITVPVEKKGVDNEKFKFTELDSFKCASKIMKGAWSNFATFYPEFIGEIMKNGHQINGTNREIYINCDFENQDNCVTEVQIGIM